MLTLEKFPAAKDALLEGRLAHALKILVDSENVDHEKALALLAPPVQPKVGDVLVSSWGYDQTNIDYYQVVAVTAKSVKIQHMSNKAAPTQGSEYHVEVLPGAVEPGAEVLLKRFHANKLTGRYHVAIASYANAYGPHDPTVSCSETGAAYGH